MNKKWSIITLLLLSLFSCSKEDKARAKNIKTINYNERPPIFTYSQPSKMKNKKYPLVLFVGPGLFFQQDKFINGNKHNFYKSFDFYFNNNKIAVGRFENIEKPLNRQDSLKSLKAFFSNSNIQNRFSYLFIVTLGEGSFLLPQLIKHKRVKAAILIGPLLGSVNESYSWKFLTEPFIHFKTCFDYNGDDAVSLNEFNRDIYHDRENEYTNKSYKDFDIDKNKTVNQTDFLIRGKTKFNDFIRQQNSPITNPKKLTWLQSIKTNILDLSKITKPIFIFHGQSDRKISWRITKKEIPKNKNIKFELVPGNDSEMNWKDTAIYRKMSAGMMAIINTVFELKKKLK